MKGSPPLRGLLLYNLHTMGRHVTKSAVPQASSPELRQFRKLLLCDAFLTYLRSQESSAIWFSLTVLVAKGADLVLSEKVTGWIATENNLVCPGTVSCH